MLRKTLELSLAFGLSLALSVPARAGVVDSPLPIIQSGASTKHVFTVPGVLNFTNLTTVFQCTSVDTNGLTVAVEVFAAAGGGPLNNVTGGGSTDGTVALGIGQTAVIATQHLFSIGEDEDLTFGATLLRGSARILSTSTKVVCTAYTMSPNATVGYMNLLPVLKGTKQRGL